MTPFDLVKYEVDKTTGYLRVDRPQRTSSQPPALYGFVPRTWCGPRVGALMTGADGGDGDPLDICVISERPIDRAEVIVTCRIIGGLPMLDSGQADDKLVAVLENDNVWSNVNDLEDLPPVFMERLRHHFMTYKMVPGGEPLSVSIGPAYGREAAHKVLAAAIADYNEAYSPQ
jgi:inorganic pyrophosphatase